MRPGVLHGGTHPRNRTIAEDPAEKTDVISKHPEIAEKLKTQLAKIIESERSR